MPIYDFWCGYCQKIFEMIAKHDEEKICPQCLSRLKKQFSGTKFVPFKPYIEENLGDEPVEIKSKKQLRQECNKRGADYI